MDTLAFLIALVALIVVHRQSKRIDALETALRTAFAPGAASPEPVAPPTVTVPNSGPWSAASSEPEMSDAARWASIQAAAEARAEREATPPPPPFPTCPVEPAPAQPVLVTRETSQRAYETLLGTRVSVWIGALLLAFGGIFLVKYSLEQGVLGPIGRVLMGIAFGAGLLAAGEVLRRRAPEAELTDGAPNIPALLTGVGALSLFGAIYAAHGLYGFLPGFLAFVLLGVIGVATMALALLHGPALAGLGLVGALAVPLLVTSRDPNVWAVALYVPIVAGVAHLFAWEKAWRMLALAASGGVILWTFALFGSDPNSSAAALLGLIGFALALFSFYLRPGAIHGEIATRVYDVVAVGLQAAVLFGALAVYGDRGSLPVWLAFATAAVALPLWASRQSIQLRVLGLHAAALVLGLTLAWPPAGAMRSVYGDVSVPLLYLLWAAAATLAVVLLALRDALEPEGHPRGFGRTVAAQIALLPPLALTVVLLRLTHGQTSWFAGFASLAAAAAYGPALLRLNRRVVAVPSQDNRLMTGSAVVACLSCITLAWFFLFQGTTLTLALAVTTAVTARVAMVYRTEILRWAVPVLACLVVARIGLDPILLRYGLGTTPILNGLLLVYGLPALAFLYAGYVLGGPEDREDAPVIVMQSLGLFLTAALAGLEIRHLTHGGSLTGGGFGVLEMGLDVSALIVAAILLLRLSRRSPAQVFAVAMQACAWTGLALGALGLGFLVNPVITDRLIYGNVVVNDLLAGYALPALVMLGLVRVAQRGPEPEFLLATRFTALWLAFLTVSLWIRFVFQGEAVGLGRGISQPELYTYSAVWIALGLGFLGYGLRFGSWPARAVGFALLFGTAGKVFLLDMAGLSGLLRAASFIGLGLVLMLVGFVYQRLFPRSGPAVGAGS